LGRGLHVGRNRDREDAPSAAFDAEELLLANVGDGDPDQFADLGIVVAVNGLPAELLVD
jgi:hypothetical protein